MTPLRLSDKSVFWQRNLCSCDRLCLIPLVRDGEGQAGPGQGKASSGDAAGAGQPRVRHTRQHSYKVCRRRERFQSEERILSLGLEVHLPTHARTSSAERAGGMKSVIYDMILLALFTRARTGVLVFAPGTGLLLTGSALPGAHLL